MRNKHSSFKCNAKHRTVRLVFTPPPPPPPERVSTKSLPHTTLAAVSDRPTEVRLGIYVNSFYSISEQTMVSTGRARRRRHALRPDTSQRRRL